MSETPNNKKGGPVFGYLAIMFAAAFLMLLLAYFIQQRNNEVAMDGLKDSLTSFESMDELLEDNRALREELDALEQELDAQTAQNEALLERISELESELDGANRRYEDLVSSWEEENSFSSVLSTLYFAETKFQEKDYTTAAAVLADWDTAFLEKIIDTYDAKYYMHYDPEGIYLRPRYDTLVTSLIDLGYLVRGEDGSLDIAVLKD